MFVATPTLHPTMAAFGNLGGSEVLLIVLVLLLLFGARKLPEVARGTGRALRIFKAETKGLMDDDDDEMTQSRSGLPSATSPDSTSTSYRSGATAAPDTTAYSSSELPPTHTEG